MTEEQNPEELASLDENMGDEMDQATQLKAELDEALREKAQYKAIAQRAQADLVNYRRRAAQELTESRENANTGLLLKLISVVDDFDRAIEMIPEDAVLPGWYEGLRLVHRNLELQMESEGLSKIETCIGESFDVQHHEALIFESNSENEEGTILRIIREGYKLRQKVLRATQVSVSRPMDKQLDNQPDNDAQEA